MIGIFNATHLVVICPDDTTFSPPKELPTYFSVEFTAGCSGADGCDVPLKDRVQEVELGKIPLFTWIFFVFCLQGTVFLLIPTRVSMEVSNYLVSWVITYLRDL